MKSAECYDLVKFSYIFVTCDLVKTNFPNGKRERTNKPITVHGNGH